MLLHSPPQRLKQRINPVDLCLKLNAKSIAPSAWFLPLKVNTSSIMSRAPRARRFSPIAFHLTRLAHLTPITTFRHKFSQHYGAYIRNLLMLLPPPLLIGPGAGHS